MDTNVTRRRLEKRRGELLDRLQKVTNDVRHSQGLAADFEEQAVQRENDDVLANLDNAIRAEIVQIDGALARLNEGQYGICEVCHRPIAANRLESLPYVTRCVKCQPAHS